MTNAALNIRRSTGDSHDHSLDAAISFPTKIDLSVAPLVWTVRLNLGPQALGESETILSPDEHLRASRFHFAIHRRRFIAARAALRIVLGRCLGCAPQTIRFRYGMNGKPAVASRSVQFNLSHSQDLALIAVAQSRAVGVDVEFKQLVPGLEHLVKHFFSPRERTLILHVSKDALASFYEHWTIKEAWLKASGEGLSGPLTDVEVRNAPDGTPQIHYVHAHAASGLPWRFVSWSPAPGFQAALAVSSP